LKQPPAIFYSLPWCHYWAWCKYLNLPHFDSTIS
jgi:hypothetical protein